ncbi:MAG: hypothetical protein AUI16_07490 [Alphaproteobacteria bacterium 13_2_20CM_2_64_7]|nr:MAG: hypothetical protein AUI16_07490 [Alphaproteobacteria bacterium 13_2_20CM_2_64_7]
MTLPQVIGREIRIIDYYEACGVDLGHYVRELAARPYVYAGHIVPHDAQAKELGTGKSRLEVLESLGLKTLQLAPMHRLEDGINAVRVSRTPPIRSATSRSRSTATPRVQASIAASNIRSKAWCECCDRAVDGE